ncbi:NAD-dependent glutamate dehydrogenase, partial [Friedmanniomyces endolithicus]
MASGHANGSSDDVNGLEPQNKLLERVVRTPGRQPSPQPTHLSVPGAMQHRVLHETGPGYVAP